MISFDGTGSDDEANDEGKTEVTKATASQYRSASKKEKGKILDQFIATTAVLRHKGRHVKTGSKL